VVETKRCVGSFVHVILTRQPCGQRSSKAAESKRRALENYFFERICYMFLMSKCKGDWDLGLCTTSGLALVESQRNGKIHFFLFLFPFFFLLSPLEGLNPNFPKKSDSSENPYWCRLTASGVRRLKSYWHSTCRAPDRPCEFELTFSLERMREGGGWFRPQHAG